MSIRSRPIRASARSIGTGKRVVVAAILQVFLTTVACQSPTRPESATRAPASPMVATDSTPNLLDSVTPVAATQLPDRAPGVTSFIACDDIFPGLPDCMGRPGIGTGRIAFTHSNDRLQAPERGEVRVVDLASGTIWHRPEPAGRLEWSLDGRYLLIQGEDEITALDLETEPIEMPLTVEPDLVISSANWAPIGYHAEAGSDRIAALLLHSQAGDLVSLTLPDGEQDVLIEAGAGVQTWPSLIGISDAGWLAWTRTDAVASASEVRGSQSLELRELRTGTALRWSISEDIATEQHELRGWLPGTRLLWTRRGALGNSLWTFGLPIATIDADLGTVQVFEHVWLPSWAEPDVHPLDAGRMVMPSGGARENFEIYELIDLDLIGGSHRVLVPESESLSVHSPRWSPSGQEIAFSAVAGLPKGATWNGESIRDIDRGRAIFLLDVETGQWRQLTQPDQASDGDPLWLPEGDRLLYERRHEAGTECPDCPQRRQLRVAWTDGSRDELLLDHIGIWAYAPNRANEGQTDVRP